MSTNEADAAYGRWAREAIRAVNDDLDEAYVRTLPRSLQVLLLRDREVTSVPVKPVLKWTELPAGTDAEDAAKAEAKALGISEIFAPGITVGREVPDTWAAHYDRVYGRIAPHPDSLAGHVEHARERVSLGDAISTSDARRVAAHAQDVYDDATRRVDNAESSELHEGAIELLREVIAEENALPAEVRVVLIAWRAQYEPNHAAERARVLYSVFVGVVSKEWYDRALAANKSAR